ncbi:uncharacterized protein LOC122088709 [Macadamia integrifolia]|uniref:uncharacterized protein LOC122088709 n=1 Tax=Macadamia integrifolia TaxID=60698 RepID=UPI001C4EC241|nr:uncharacterized protein LOC122088709 [Macadamia integrifolia]
METSGGGNRRRLTHQVSVIDTSNLRNLLRSNSVDENNNRDSLAGLTLGAVLSGEEKRSVRVPPVSRTLLDFINEESGTRGLSGPNRKSWKSFRDRLRLRRASAAWASSSSDGDSDDCSLHISEPTSADPLEVSIESTQPVNGPEGRGDVVPEYEAVTAANRPVMMRLAAALANERELQRQREIEREGLNPIAVGEEVREEEEEEEVVEQAVVAEAEETAPVRMSLMALLEETDRQAGLLGSTLTGDVADEEEEEVDEDIDDDGGEYVCCVCMVRHKGAAFIPCGHTFCRLCSRELWVTRGNCPLCNGFILEILDIF